MILFLYGDDDFQSNEKLVAIKNKFSQKDSLGSTSSVFDFEEEKNVSDIQDSFRAEGLFSTQKLIIIKNIFSEGSVSEQESILDFLKGNKNVIENKDTTVVFWEKGSPRKNNKFFKFLIKNVKNKEFKRLSGAKLSLWAKAQIQTNNARMSEKALQKLVSYVGNDLWSMKNEVNKLVSYSEGKEISEEDVDALVKSKIEANIFETIDALASKNKSKALRFLHDQLEKGDDPFYIFSMYVYQFRNLLKIEDFYLKGITNNYEIAKVAKVHPFVAQKGIAQVRGFGKGQLKKIYKKLGELDLGIKTGKIDITLALDKFVVENC